MAGVKGKSGGPRKNAGGARPGAGRKPKAAPKQSANAPTEIAERDMLQFLTDVALGRIDASQVQVRAAIAAVQYTHTKRGDGGKKDEKADRAQKASTGRFGAPPAPPRLVVGGKK